MVDCSFQILWGYGIRQPYAVFRAIEQQAVTGHPGCVNGEEDWPSVPPANFHGDFRIGGEVYLMSFYGPQPFLHDRTDKSLPSPMPQNRRGCVGYQFQIHGNGMSLIGTDARLVWTEGILLYNVRRMLRIQEDAMKIDKVAIMVKKAALVFDKVSNPYFSE